MASSPAGTRFWSRTVPSTTPPSPAARLVSGVTSKSGRSVNLIPGTSRPGGRASAASSRDDPAQGNSGTGSPSSFPAPARCGCRIGRTGRPPDTAVGAGCMATMS